MKLSTRICRSLVYAVYAVIQMTILALLLLSDLTIYHHIVLMSAAVFLYYSTSLTRASKHFKHVSFEPKDMSCSSKKESGKSKLEITKGKENQLGSASIRTAQAAQASENKESVKNKVEPVEEMLIENQLQTVAQQLINPTAIVNGTISKQTQQKELVSQSSLHETKHQKRIQCSPPLPGCPKRQAENRNNKKGEIIAKDPMQVRNGLECVRRACNLCNSLQPFRVRHCHQCEQCITTFDHHCPWMNNCIGENNRPIFILFLLFQTLQLLFLVIDLVEQAHSGQARNLYIARHPAQALLLGVCALMMLAGTLFLFLVQIYLISINLTTWQLLRWDRIEYLNLFDKKALNSPFDKGICINFIRFWTGAFCIDRCVWEQYLLQAKINGTPETARGLCQ